MATNGIFTLMDDSQSPNSRRFLNAYAIDVVRPETPLSQPMVESWVANTLGPHVRDSVRSYVDSQSWEALKDRDGLPASWWEKQFSAWLNDYGIVVRVDALSWTSAEAVAAEADAARRKDFERIAQAKQSERQAELREAAAKAQYEKTEIADRAGPESLRTGETASASASWRSDIVKTFLTRIWK